jgi:hypothetical protein
VEPVQVRSFNPPPRVIPGGIAFVRTDPATSLWPTGPPGNLARNRRPVLGRRIFLALSSFLI